MVIELCSGDFGAARCLPVVVAHPTPRGCGPHHMQLAALSPARSETALAPPLRAGYTPTAALGRLARSAATISAAPVSGSEHCGPMQI